MKRSMQWGLAALLACALSTALAGKLPVVASFSMVADMTRQVGGDRVDVTALVGADQDAHVFQPAPADVRRLSQARVFVVNGLGLEGWLGRLTGSAGFKGVTIVASRGVTSLKASGGDEAGGLDPHAWQDPQRVLRYIATIRDGLIAADPDGRAGYTARAAAFSARVAALDRWAAAAFAAVPPERRKVLTSHDAFAYLGARYQIRFLAPQGVSTDAEASARKVAELVRQIRRERVKAVYFENMSDQRVLRQIANEAGVAVNDKLYSDALSDARGPAATWEAMFRYNVSTLLKALK
ncbi:metal ABC transporter solute-binding protein, Zn/Mn family [Paludibacterium yongneupense]|uniref:metal ABC transporter solute-binding protein, Zn/Mn family n=1 Tax=Paludibacterium yongneupense TaxID=400061 RepID=UPI00041059EE|nr:zinc ABC transporter substrate-binding protein [Paludibacterium yongneupense]